MSVLEPTKTKLAQRVIEVFEYFDDRHRSASVMDIVRRYGRPQSSTSELLCSLVEIGLLYKDPRSRRYWPTPRLAAMGSSAHLPEIGNGRMFRFMSDLVQSARHSVALFGIVGTHVQVFHWIRGPRDDAPHVPRGSSIPLTECAAGQLLLTTIAPQQLDRLLRRLNAEALSERKFEVAKMSERVEQFRKTDHVTGHCGFVPGNLVTAMLLPCSDAGRPLAIGFIHPQEAVINRQALLATLKHGIDDCFSDHPVNDAARPLLVAM
jgi:DNA-binding IclR family transcriptional regulator